MIKHIKLLALIICLFLLGCKSDPAEMGLVPTMILCVETETEKHCIDNIREVEAEESLVIVKGNSIE